MTVISTKDAACQVGISIVALNKHLRAGHLPSARQLSNGNWIISQEMIEKFIADRAAGFVPKRGRRRKTAIIIDTPNLPETVRKQLRDGCLIVTQEAVDKLLPAIR